MRPALALATELTKVGVITAAAVDYDWLIPFPVEWSVQTIVQWLRDHPPAKEFLLHCDGRVLRVKMP